MIKNACATQAILSVLLNADHPDVALGSVLENLKKFTAGFDPMVGLRMFVCCFLSHMYCMHGDTHKYPHEQHRTHDVMHMNGTHSNICTSTCKHAQANKLLSLFLCSLSG